jgi:hypothetical protein
MPLWFGAKEQPRYKPNKALLHEDEHRRLHGGQHDEDQSQVADEMCAEQDVSGSLPSWLGWA